MDLIGTFAALFGLLIGSGTFLFLLRVFLIVGETLESVRGLRTDVESVKARVFNVETRMMKLEHGGIDRGKLAKGSA